LGYGAGWGDYEGEYVESWDDLEVGAGEGTIIEKTDGGELFVIDTPFFAWWGVGWKLSIPPQYLRNLILRGGELWNLYTPLST
jgi:hypothetical protein